VKFVIFHGGYPYGQELSTMAKNFPGVYIDMCWLAIISPQVVRAYFLRTNAIDLFRLPLKP